MTRPRCSNCQRALPTCYCHTLKPVENRWPVWILQHPLETRHALGTAQMAALSLTNSVLWVGEKPESCTPAQEQIAARQPVLIYPGDDSSDLESLDSSDTVPLLFLDGSWRKTRRMLHESPLLAALPKVSFNAANSSRYKLRKPPKPENLSTLEAIVQVLSVLEGNAEKFHPLLASMDWMIARQIELMGEHIYRQNYLK